MGHNHRPSRGPRTSATRAGFGSRAMGRWGPAPGLRLRRGVRDGGGGLPLSSQGGIEDRRRWQPPAGPVGQPSFERPFPGHPRGRPDPLRRGSPERRPHGVSARRGPGWRGSLRVRAAGGEGLRLRRAVSAWILWSILRDLLTRLQPSFRAEVTLELGQKLGQLLRQGASQHRDLFRLKLQKQNQGMDDRGQVRPTARSETSFECGGDFEGSLTEGFVPGGLQKFLHCGPEDRHASRKIDQDGVPRPRARRISRSRREGFHTDLLSTEATLKVHSQDTINDALERHICQFASAHFEDTEAMPATQ